MYFSIQTGLLSGHFLIDVYDGAYAEAHVGLLNFQVDIVKAYICFKGHIGYNLNVLKVLHFLEYKENKLPSVCFYLFE